MSTLSTQDKLLDFISQNGLGLIRCTLYWDSYLADPTGYSAKVKATADAADRYGLRVIYAFMQYNLSSVFGGGGFPASLVTSTIGPVANYATQLDAKKAFLRVYYDSPVIPDQQAAFMVNLLAPYKDRASTYGYEVFNEAPILADADHEKLKAAQENVANKLLAMDPDAWIVATHRHLLYSDMSFWNAVSIKRTIPTTSNGKVAYGPHCYWRPPKVTQADFDYVFNSISAVNMPTIISEWDIETFPADPVKMKTVIDFFKSKGWSHCLYIFDSQDKYRTCFNASYDVETTRNVWPALMTAMGRTQTGAPK